MSTSRASLLSPPEFARLVSRHGTTTVIADPHEIANVCGAEGIEFMLGWRGRIPIDLFIMLPSCVPATPVDPSGATLGSRDLAAYAGREETLRGEVMHVQGVLMEDPDMREKIGLFPLVDGHAPLLSGRDLNAYIVAGIQSDHESSGYDEAREKLEKGIYIFIREGWTLKNIASIIPLVSWKTVSQISFATDDRHADMLEGEGHIEDCIRKAAASGLEENWPSGWRRFLPLNGSPFPTRGRCLPGERD